MILTSLRLTDFGTFKGVQELALRPKPGKPIVLFGGMNGAGKSTILEAIRLCFYGQQALGGRFSREQYFTYLKNKIHRNPNFIIQPTYSSVSVEFEFADPEGVHAYRVTRGWEDHGTRLVEDLQIEQDGRELDQVSSDHWQDFIRDLIPIGVSQLFFFDGEKIQQLAEDSSDQGALMSAVKLLLGVDVVERLDTDLGVYLSRALSQRGTRETNQLATFEAQLAGTQTRLATKRQDKGRCEKEIIEIKKTVDALEHQLASSGGNFAQNREACLRERQRTRSDMSHARDELRDLCGDLLPFSICRALCLQLKKSLEVEERDEERRVTSAFAARAAAQIRMRLIKSKDISLRVAERKGLADEIASMLTSMASPVEGKAVHGCSVEERRKLLQWIDQATGEMPKRAAVLFSRLEQLTRAEHKVEAELKKMLPEDTLKPLLSDLQQKYRELAEADHNLNVISGEIQTLEKTVADLSRRCQEEANKLAASTAEQSRISLVPKIREVLSEFKSALLLRRVQALEEAVTRCFNDLCRKKDSMRQISIDPSSFAVIIKDKDGHPISKGQLSAGEKQIYAISMLWALGKTSGRPLPVIVDTPLARLDRDHRSLLAEHYFPNASHQVLILSTDTEVDEEYFERLTPAISKAYLLHFDQSDRFTTATPGYFWRREHETLEAQAL